MAGTALVSPPDKQNVPLVSSVKIHVSDGDWKYNANDGIKSSGYDIESGLEIQSLAMAIFD